MTSGSFIAGTDRKQFQFTVPTPASGEEIGPWSFLYISGSAVIPAGRYGVVSVAPPVSGSVVVRCISETAIPGAATTFTGTAYLDECFTFSDRIPAEIAASTRSRWSASVVTPSASFGGKFSILGGVQSTIGTSFTLLRSDLAKRLLAHAPRPILSADADAVAIDPSGPISSTATNNPLTASPLAGQGREVFIDRECISLIDDTTSDDPNMRRGALGTIARAHTALSPLYRGIPSGIGRDVEIWVYDNPAHCYDTQFRFSGICEAPEFSQAANEFTFTVRGETFRPRSVIPESDVLALVKRPVMGRVVRLDIINDGAINYIEVAQSDPESTWSWVRFGSVLVRIKKTEIVTSTDLGYCYVRYLLPYGLHPEAFTTADPKISQEDALNLAGGLHGHNVNSIYGAFFEWSFYLTRDVLVSDLEALIEPILEERRYFFNEKGHATSSLYYSAAPELCHLFERPGKHAEICALNIWDSVNTSDIVTVNTSGFYLPRVSVFDICEQVVRGINGGGVGFDLLPAELSCASQRTISRVQMVNEPSVTAALVTASKSGDLGKFLSDSVLRPAFCSLALDVSGNWRFIFPVGFSGNNGAKYSAAVDLDSLIDSGGEPFSLLISPDSALREIVVEIVSLSTAFVNAPENRREFGRDANVSGFLAAGDIYAGAVNNSQKFTYILDTNEAGGGYVWNQHILSMFSRPAYLLSGNVHRSYTGEVGDYVPVTVKEIPDIYGENNFTGYGFVIERSINFETDESRATWLLFPDPSQGSRTWSPAVDINLVNSAESFEFDASQYAKFNDGAFPFFRPGDKVALLNEYGERLDDSGATVATYSLTNTLTGTMTLVAGFTLSGSPVTLAVGNTIVHNDRALQTDLLASRFAWFDAAETNPSRWI
jgi:hypothetical protein